MYCSLGSVRFLSPIKMAAINSCKIPGFDNARFQIITPSASCLFFRPSTGPVKLPRLRINKTQELCFRAPRISCLLEDGREKHFSFSKNSQQEEAAIDLKLPRRSLLVTFTCDACGARSQRLINRLAYERGLVYVQCSGCSQYHKLVDNLGLVVEYKLQDEIDFDANTDHS